MFHNISIFKTIALPKKGFTLFNFVMAVREWMDKSNRKFIWAEN